jgi:predicted TIM-barrel fold metal-dependent hydrolase
MSISAADPVIVVSCDSHVGPRLREDLRGYCPQKYLRDFDDFVVAHEARRAEMARTGVIDERARFAAGHPNISIDGHHDVHARLADMDRDGVAAEVIYHFSQNGEPMPLVSDPGGGLGTVPATAFELGAVGYEIYNRWLADFVSVESERHVGLAYLPMWDVDAAVRQLEWAREAGLRGVNFPPPSRAGHLEYNNPAWEPFWSACEAYGMSLNTHSSGAAAFDYFSGPGGEDLLIYECGGWMARRALWWLIHGQVFERHPNLKLVITEQFEGWWTSTLHELDSVYVRFGMRGNVLPKMPSDYARHNVFMGASFLSPSLAEQAFREGFVDNVLWGRDYPHIEGAFQVHADGAEPIAHLSLRNSLSRVPLPAARAIAGENAMRVFGLERSHLISVAARIDAPSAAALATPPRDLPTIAERSNAFRGQAGARPLDAAVSL